ncbi:MAG TPA: hypothetical protein VN323_08190 [Candidatus Dormibacteraeota bacterium]|jgi:hypothetical protein|nr:hypothetical protein [Candidatus Dormibacteraeota bacterium]
MNDSSLKIALPLYVQQLEKHAPAYAANAKVRLTALEGIHANCKSGLDQNKVNPDLSPEGRFKAALAMARPTVQQVADWRAANPDKVSQQIRTMWERVLGIAATKPPTDVGERLAHELRAREIRDQVRALDPLQRLSIYFASTDPEVIAAFEDGPPTLDHGNRGDPPKLAAFIDADQVRAAMVERARAADPEAAAQMQALAVVRDIYQAAADTVMHEILAEFPSLKHDPLVAQAAGVVPTGR